MVISLFTSAIGPLLMREMSIAHARGDRDRMAYLFQRLLPSFAFAAAVPSCFLAYEAGTVSLIIGGPMFVGAKWVLGVMALIPIYAAYGYVSATIYFATGQMKLYRNIGMAAYVPGIVMTVVLVGPSGWFGWNLGASGLAIKYLATAVLLHNGFMFFNCRYLRLRFRTIVLQQVGIIVLLLLLAALSQMLGSVLLGAVGAASTIVRLVLDASIYVLLAAALLAALPRLAGLDRAQLLALIVPLAQRVSARP
jgi:O-antigen/teichoic acid export membrane protein